MKKRFFELDALRGIATVIVVLCHFMLFREDAQIGFRLFTNIIDIFFILSGFVIFMTLTKIKSSKDFIINRLARLFPTYWVVVTFTFCLILFHQTFSEDFAHITIYDYLANMTMFQFYIGYADLDGPYWTLIIEMLFYIVMLIIFILKCQKYIHHIGIAASSILAFLAYYPMSSANEELFAKSLLNIPLLQYIPLFFGGILFYHIFIKDDRTLLKYAGILFYLVAQIMLFDYSGRAQYFMTHLEYGIMLTVYFGLFVLFINGKLKFIVSKPTVFLGKISYALYLIHQFLTITLLVPYLEESWGINFWIATIVIALPIAIALAALITYYVEIPVNRYVRNKYRRDIIRTETTQNI
jgi:peptidoglycan/LPS O-acetylase OafA/YrhL